MPLRVSTTELTDAQAQRDSEPAVPTTHDDVLLICVNYRKPAETKRFGSSAREQPLNSSLRVEVGANRPFPGEGGVADQLEGDLNLEPIAPEKKLDGSGT